jgi:hypothetical protein
MPVSGRVSGVEALRFGDGVQVWAPALAVGMVLSEAVSCAVGRLAGSRLLGR